MFWTYLISCGALFAATGVALGAFGAHTLKNILSDGQLQTFDVGVRYQMYHALGVIALALVMSRLDNYWLRSAGVLMVLGTLIFSGSLYAIVFSQYRQLGAITPVGGLMLIVSWLCLAIGSFR